MKYKGKIVPSTAGGFYIMYEGTNGSSTMGPFGTRRSAENRRRLHEDSTFWRGTEQKAGGEPLTEAQLDQIAAIDASVDNALKEGAE